MMYKGALETYQSLAKDNPTKYNDKIEKIKQILNQK